MLGRWYTVLITGGPHVPVAGPADLADTPTPSRLPQDSPDRDLGLAVLDALLRCRHAPWWEGEGARTTRIRIALVDLHWHCGDGCGVISSIAGEMGL